MTVKLTILGFIFTFHVSLCQYDYLPSHTHPPWPHNHLSRCRGRVHHHLGENLARALEVAYKALDPQAALNLRTALDEEAVVLVTPNPLLVDGIHHEIIGVDRSGHATSTVSPSNEVEADDRSGYDTDIEAESSRSGHSDKSEYSDIADNSDNNDIGSVRSGHYNNPSNTNSEVVSNRPGYSSSEMVSSRPGYSNSEAVTGRHGYSNNAVSTITENITGRTAYTSNIPSGFKAYRRPTRVEERRLF